MTPAYVLAKYNHMPHAGVPAKIVGIGIVSGPEFSGPAIIAEYPSGEKVEIPLREASRVTGNYRFGAYDELLGVLPCNLVYE